jgi:hypothetical protein
VYSSISNYNLYTVELGNNKLDGTGEMCL